MASPGRTGVSAEAEAARRWLERIAALTLPRPVKIMNVCGGHERSIAHAGLRSLLPEGVELIPGPGCPVCVCPEEDVYAAIRIALDREAIVVSFGDMLRVPANVGKGEIRSLEQAKAAGADVRAVASPLEAVVMARAQPSRTVVFFAAGFETTMAPVAAMLSEPLPDNLLLLLSGRRTWPAVAMLLASGRPGFDALIAPGHVSTVMGPEEWAFVAEEHGLPCAIAGFSADSLLAAVYSTLRQVGEGRAFLDNCYPAAVREGGNAAAQRHLARTMTVVDAPWRGIGTIPASGYALAPAYAGHDARPVFAAEAEEGRRRAGEMPPGCACADVVLGRIYPTACPLYGGGCAPRHPVGPCMVSDEGACRIWWSTGARGGTRGGARDGSTPRRTREAAAA
ncbi:MAG: hydrogenase formation protein HypD [Rhodospirillales bacterium]|nr:hydrogenase formation protein HypD [Rhodospirillales bacterium]